MSVIVFENNLASYLKHEIQFALRCKAFRFYRNTHCQSMVIWQESTKGVSYRNQENEIAQEKLGCFCDFFSIPQPVHWI